MTFPNATEVRKSITKYCIFKVVALKYVKNERNRIMVKCEDLCPFVLWVLKDNNNLELVVRNLVLDRNHYRIFTNPRVSTTFLSQHYKIRILENHAYKIKDMKNDVEKELRLNVGYSKCKQVKRMVLDAYSEAFKIEFSELEAYAYKLLRSNPVSIVKVEVCRDDLKEGRRIIVCLNVYKKRMGGSL